MGEPSSRAPGSPARRVAFAIAVLLLLALQLGGLGRPLFWQDEGETAMFGRRILDYGYPKVHGAEGVVYGMGVPLEVAVDAERDAYTGSLWGQYYLAALGVAWADGVSDPYAQSLRVRLPFALSGLAGLGLLLLAVRGALAARSGSALPAATAFVLLACVSTSLLLHLREARYYGPTLGLVGLAVWLAGRLRARLEAGRPSWPLAAALAAALVALLNFFYPAAVALMAWLVLEALLGARRARATGRAAGPLLAAYGGPVAVALACAAPLALFFEVADLSQVMSARWSFGPADYVANLGHLAIFLVRFELLGLVLVAELGLVVTRAAASRDGRAARPLALALARLAALYALVGAFNPIFFERYFVPLGPLLALVLVLDVEVLLGRLAGPDTGHVSAASRRLVALGLLVALVATLALRRSELIGRVREIASPVPGPVDAIVAHLRTAHERPGELVIATNYEAEPLMFYLGSRVVGRFHSGRAEAIAAERAVRPDVVIPRSGHPRRLEAVRAYIAPGEFAPRRLGVTDTPYNHIPELYPGRVLRHTHWFRPPTPGEGSPALIVYERKRRER